MAFCAFAAYISPSEIRNPNRRRRAVERKLLQIAFAFAGLALVGFGFAAPLSWLGLRRVAGAALRRALT